LYVLVEGHVADRLFLSVKEKANANN